MLNVRKLKQNVLGSLEHNNTKRIQRNGALKCQQKVFKFPCDDIKSVTVRYETNVKNENSEVVFVKSLEMHTSLFVVN